jgi:hypothetical protein
LMHRPTRKSKSYEKKQLLGFRNVICECNCFNTKLQLDCFDKTSISDRCIQFDRILICNIHIYTIYSNKLELIKHFSSFVFYTAHKSNLQLVHLASPHRGSDTIL